MSSLGWFSSRELIEELQSRAKSCIVVLITEGEEDNEVYISDNITKRELTLVDLLIKNMDRKRRKQ